MQQQDSSPMTPWQMWMSLSQRIHQQHCRLEEQQLIINRLIKQVTDLTERMKASESRPLYHIDSLSYHFDQLKVEKLDGTLNIGMTPPSEETVKEIGQLVMPGPSETKVHNPPPVAPLQQNGTNNNQQTSAPNVFPTPTSNPALSPDAANLRPPYPEIRGEVDFYLNKEAPARLIHLESEFGVSLDPYHRQLIIEDIRKQISSRIQYYIHSSIPNGASNQEALQVNELRQIKSDVWTKTTRDIDHALRAYLSRLQSNSSQA
ncbi:spore germination protein GerPC [Paenibacillus solisilvae]|uniref:Spore germination protein GerPC n=1 Tax=Paenibacillus solisilvae TaxID=2486751 RepID=A0ABW0W4H7_9BACL